METLIKTTAYGLGFCRYLVVGAALVLTACGDDQAVTEEKEATVTPAQPTDATLAHPASGDPTNVQPGLVAPVPDGQ